MDRHEWTALSVVAVLVMVLAAVAGCGGTATTTASGGGEATTTAGAETTITFAVSGEPIKIGVLNPLTGPQVHEGSSVNQGFQTYLESIGNQVAGRPIQLIFEDDASNPQQGLERVRKLVERDKVNIITCPVNSGVVLGVVAYAAEKEVPAVVPVSHVNAITDEERSPYVFRTVESSRQRSVAPAYYIAKELGLLKAAVFSWDFVVGQEMIADFVEAYESFGGEVVYTQAAPLGTQDFGPFLSTIDKKKIDVIYSFYASPDNIRFVQQLQQFGFTPNIPLVDNGTLTEEGVLPEQGDAALGALSVTGYSNALDNPENKAFMSLWAEKFNGAKPNWYTFQGWNMAMVIVAGIEGVNGNVEDKEAFLKSMQAVKINTPVGPFSFDERGQAIMDQYSYEVVKLDDGTLGKKWLGDKWEAVGQDWTPPAN
ncbi:MAG: ABC transporter substrate-binding protein [Actinobacteria bacterium]|nr:ABC transporter substrate-binding protein [Actinomycetota bacterium]